MSFLIYDLIFLAAFTLFVVLFLYKRRGKLQREGPLFLYRTKVGIKAINYFSTKFKKQLNWLQYVSIAIGYILMATMLYLFFQIVYMYAKFPDAVRAVKIPPVMPLIPYLPAIFKVSFLPPFYFTYWILILAVVAIFHEFSHGIFAKLHNLKIKSTGFGFLGPFLAAFVEPDEKKMEKKSIKSQLAILSAGTFANIIISIIFIIIFILFFYLMFVPAGATFNTYTYSTINISQLTEINGKDLNFSDTQILLANLDLKNERNLTNIKIGDKSYLIDNNEVILKANEVNEAAVVFDDLPAIRSGLSGAIIEFNGKKIKSAQELSIELTKYKPQDSVIIKTNDNGKINSYNITLASNNGRAYLGIGLIQPSTSGIKGAIYLAVSSIRNPGTFYDSRFNSDFTMFIYDLIWWMILINISVALVNMLPLGIFDGGRVFYLTILYFTKSDNVAKKAFKIMTWFLLLLVVLVMIFWFYSMFA